LEKVYQLSHPVFWTAGGIPLGVKKKKSKKKKKLVEGDPEEGEPKQEAIMSKGEIAPCIFKLSCRLLLGQSLFHILVSFGNRWSHFLSLSGPP
jgi:hypothetical protein